MSFSYQVIDEAQYIKNHSTQNAKSVKAIKSDYRLALTGTPIENRLSELWSTFDYLMPGYLYSYQKFKRRFETPIVKNGDAYAVELLKRMTDPFILRRLKSEVLSELPPKTETLVQTSMEGEQRKLYVANALKLRTRSWAGRGGYRSSSFPHPSYAYKIEANMLRPLSVMQITTGQVPSWRLAWSL